ncbi:MAG: glutamine--fructose-6-phosphate aminotransferase [Bacteroidetes bacterium GWF2_43_63]|nr:MAG: glutamine--fructose-6-phosphate aminotransferase [Bacteroidetes bacterium GWE2_42_42]OFY53299.1 MAG: glutamine--fructose-6-phosphate aminotransferase [Bacteroidetes bacterium GWF2_43_63]HBG71707.1 glutamine--fructose-6-phosphate transaminase (isomerizing) [Bacteroidales bacterium]HCB61628.1 glutamine--fructose-6-phosphate transaminase (isomerizing) [Bacteroidales bacterium]HCY22840.1 glutamine--fructose-6-phosphate transaminase (isomerizing) [Bacteroidales bacterium]
MCGIVGYLGPRQAYPILINGLHRLEYRGYDSAGVALVNGGLRVFKSMGKVRDLEELVKNENLSGTIGIAHTRWATHGEPNQVNAHPHVSPSGKMAMIHNGIIENYAILKEELINRGYEFKSHTDTEVLIHLIEDIQINEKTSLVEAVQIALSQVIGAYAIVITSQDNPNMLIAAKKGSPMVIGIGTDEFFIASDATPIVEYTKNVVYLEDEEIAILERGQELKIKTIKNIDKTPYVQKLEINLGAIEKGGYPHFMLKEIHEQPNSIRDCMRGRLSADQGIISLGGIVDYEQKLCNAKRIIIVACGTSWHAGLVGEYLIEDLARINVEVEYASEFRYRNPVITEDDIIIAISQSGETADTLAAIKLAKSKGATILGICNVVGSTIARATDAGSYTHAGPEIGVASTKAFTAQVTILTMLALMLGHQRGTISKSKYNQYIHELDRIPEKAKITLDKAHGIIEKIAEQYKDVRNFLYLGRGYNFPVAMEGALKLKEISYIHAEGYPAAEMKHGPIALIDEKMPVVVIATNRGTYDKVVSNIQEVKARAGKIIAVVTEGDTAVKGMSDYVMEIPETEEFLVPLLATIPLQLLAYHIAVLRGCNVDQPRNLAKSVTVE